MAVDETLLFDAAENGTATLRFYSWDEPTLSLGYFQRYADREQHTASRTCAVVRRQTGGGAILHDRELTYSLALPAQPSADKTKRASLPNCPRSLRRNPVAARPSFRLGWYTTNSRRRDKNSTEAMSHSYASSASLRATSFSTIGSPHRVTTLCRKCRLPARL